MSQLINPSTRVTGIASKQCLTKMVIDQIRYCQILYFYYTSLLNKVINFGKHITSTGEKVTSVIKNARKSLLFDCDRT